MLTAIQTNRLTSYESIEAELTRDPSVYAMDEGMKEIAETLSKHLDALRPLRQLGVRNAKGSALAKSEAKRHLADIASEVAGDLYSFGAKTRNRTLQAETNYSPHDLMTLRGARLLDTTEHLLAVATARGAEMETQAISEGRRNELRAAIDAFGSKKNQGRETVVASAAVRQDTKAHFSAIAELLTDRLQRALRKYKRHNQGFYTRVTVARAVLDLPGSRPTVEEPSV